jgi:hypothetical protein
MLSVSDTGYHEYELKTLKTKVEDVRFKEIELRRRDSAELYCIRPSLTTELNELLCGTGYH